jgi:hypothetical protein
LSWKVICSLCDCEVEHSAVLTAMLTSPSHSESPFAMAVGAAGQQYLTSTGGPMGNIRGVTNEQLLLTRVSDNDLLFV